MDGNWYTNFSDGWWVSFGFGLPHLQREHGLDLKELDTILACLGSETATSWKEYRFKKQFIQMSSLSIFQQNWRCTIYMYCIMMWWCFSLWFQALAWLTWSLVTSEKLLVRWITHHSRKVTFRSGFHTVPVALLIPRRILPDSDLPRFCRGWSVTFSRIIESTMMLDWIRLAVTTSGLFTELYKRKHNHNKTFCVFDVYASHKWTTLTGPFMITIKHQKFDLN